MSERELAQQLIERLPEEKLGYVIGYLQGLQTLEADDDAFCERLYQQYLADDDPERDEGVELGACKEAWGIA